MCALCFLYILCIWIQLVNLVRAENHDLIYIVHVANWPLRKKKKKQTISLNNYLWMLFVNFFLLRRTFCAELCNVSKCYSNLFVCDDRCGSLPSVRSIQSTSLNTMSVWGRSAFCLFELCDAICDDATNVMIKKNVILCINFADSNMEIFHICTIMFVVSSKSSNLKLSS